MSRPETYVIIHLARLHVSHVLNPEMAQEMSGDEHIRAIVQDGPGGPEVLKVGDHAKPYAGPGRVLIKSYATALNGADLLQRSGKYSPPEGAPNILGLEVAGEIVEDGSEDPKFKKGDRVFGLLDGGGYAEFVAASQGLIMPLPGHLSYEQGAAIPEVFLTAYLELNWLGKLQEGEDLLIHAGASGVGTAAIQLAKQIGARVFVTAGSDEKCQFAKDLGADEAINYNKEDFLEVLKAKTSDKKFATGVPIIGSTQKWGVDVILDLVGAGNFTKNIDALNLEGRLLLVGTGSGIQSEINLAKIISKRLQIIGSTLRARPLRQKERLIQEFAEYALPRFEDGTFKPIVDKVFKFEDVVEAHKYLEGKKNKGKIILKIEH